MENEEGKGSGRSIPGFDLHNALCKSSAYLKKYGGHEMAVGLSLEKQKFNDFRVVFEEHANSCNLKEIIPIININKQVINKELTIQNIKDLEKLEPYGEGNKCPLFSYKNLKVDSIRSLTEGKHMKLTLKADNNNIIIAMGFNMGNRAEEFLIGDKVDIVGTLEVNEFNGIESAQFNLKDIMKSF